MSRAIILSRLHRRQTDRQPRGPQVLQQKEERYTFGRGGRSISHRLSQIRRLRRGVKMGLGGGPSSQVERRSKNPSFQPTHHPGPALPCTPRQPATEQGLDQGWSPLPPAVPCFSDPGSGSVICFLLSPPSHPHCLTLPLPRFCSRLLTPSLPLSSIQHLSDV